MLTSWLKLYIMTFNILREKVPLSFFSHAESRSLLIDYHSFTVMDWDNKITETPAEQLNMHFTLHLSKETTRCSQHLFVTVIKNICPC